MSTKERLDQTAARANVSTEGPLSHDGGGVYRVGADGDELIVADFGLSDNPHCDAAFIASAREDVLWLIEQVRKRDAALKSVLDLHPPVEYGWWSTVVCETCEGKPEYPCPTVRAIAEGVGSE